MSGALLFHIKSKAHFNLPSRKCTVASYLCITASVLVIQIIFQAILLLIFLLNDSQRGKSHIIYFKLFSFSLHFCSFSFTLAPIGSRQHWSTAGINKRWYLLCVKRSCCLLITNEGQRTAGPSWDVGLADLWPLALHTLHLLALLSAFMDGELLLL